MLKWFKLFKYLCRKRKWEDKNIEFKGPLDISYSRKNYPYLLSETTKREEIREITGLDVDDIATLVKGEVSLTLSVKYERDIDFIIDRLQEGYNAYPF